LSVSEKLVDLSVIFAAFLDAGCFAAEFAEIVKLRPADLTFAYDLYLFDARAMDGEYSFYSYPGGYLSDDKVLANSAVLASDNDSFKYLDAFAVAFFNFNVGLLLCPLGGTLKGFHQSLRISSQ